MRETKQKRATEAAGDAKNTPETPTRAKTRDKRSQMPPKRDGHTTGEARRPAAGAADQSADQGTGRRVQREIKREKSCTNRAQDSACTKFDPEQSPGNLQPIRKPKQKNFSQTGTEPTQKRGFCESSVKRKKVGIDCATIAPNHGLIRRTTPRKDNK